MHSHFKESIRRCPRWAHGCVAGLLSVIWLGCALVFQVAGAQQTILELKFDEGSGNTTHDSGPSHLTGQITSATWTTGHSGKALQFRGGKQFETGDAVTVKGSAGMDFSVPFSVEAWVFCTGREVYQAIVDQHEYKTGLAAGFTLYLTDGRLRISLYSGENGNADAVGTSDLRDSRWHYVRGFWDGLRLEVHVDGRREAQTAWAFPPAMSSRDICVGLRAGGWGGYLPFQGTIDEVVIRRDLPVQYAGYSAFAKLDDIQGDATEPLHRGWVELLNFQGGVARETVSADVGSTTPRVRLLPFVASKWLDRASVPLVHQCAEGLPLREVVVDLTWNPLNKVRFYQMKLTDVAITRVSIQAGVNPEPRGPVETFQLECRRIEWTYTQVDASGRGFAEVRAQLDAGTGTAEERSRSLPPDSDSDGIPDETELSLHLQVAEDDASLDYDRDGLNNYQEYLAGTNPWVADSVLKVTGVLAVVGGQARATITWKSSPGEVYDILSGESLLGPYRRAATVAADAEVATCELGVSGPNHFFIVQLRE